MPTEKSVEFWKCDCGIHIRVVHKEGRFIEFAPAGLAGDCRFSGEQWEHYHGYPIGHVAMMKTTEAELNPELT